ncbi:hypothetical protein K7432_010140 [Basidiobolus ranarum]|uniref:P-type domain-containing protein n=1 Tax=Basidiobolus ranarum TaxID=34480 RepID=A0ABR2WP75_9FUNG
MYFLIFVISLLFAKGCFSQFFDQSFDCGWPGITRQQCDIRTGCQYSPLLNSNFGSACFFPSSLVYRRISCGPENVTPEDCTKGHSCIYRKDKTGSPACFHKHPPGGLKFADENIDCGWLGINSNQCRTSLGCIWKPKTGGNHCFYPRHLSNDRIPCGRENISHSECTNRKCLYDSISEGNQASCFYLPGIAPRIDIPTGYEAIATLTSYIVETRNIAE